jgi:hypothetical protein
VGDSGRATEQRAVDPVLLPDQIMKPIGNPAFWWITMFIA